MRKLILNNALLVTNTRVKLINKYFDNFKWAFFEKSEIIRKTKK